MSNTSVTCILSGTYTYARRWVRYEIARSIVKGNGILVVRVNSMKDRTGNASPQGPNPLAFMGMYKVGDGRILLAEVNGGKWVRYEDYTQAVTLPAGWRQPASTNVVRLSEYAGEYCYVANNGAQNFAGWVQAAAAAAGR
jgi:hypothetical protein